VVRELLDVPALVGERDRNALERVLATVPDRAHSRGVYASACGVYES
jgi:hypothetical protein